MNIAITGGTSDVARALARSSVSPDLRLIFAPPSGVLNLTDHADLWDRWLTEVQPRAIIHLAGRKPPASESAMMAANVRGTETLLRAVRTTAPGARVILASSASVYGNTLSGHLIDVQTPRSPISAYGKSKALQEELAEEHCQAGYQVTIARIFNIVGGENDRTSVVPSLVRRMLDTPDGGECRLRDADAVRDFIDVQDVAGAMLSACRVSTTIPYMNVCTGIPVTISQVVTRIANLIPRDIRIVPIEEDKPGGIAWSVGNDVEARSTGWQPSVPPDESISKVIALLR